MAPRGPGAHLPSLVADAAAASPLWLLRKSRPTAAAAAAVAAAASAVVAVATRSTSSSSTTTTTTRSPSSSEGDTEQEGPARYERAVSKGLRACARESHAYGRCAAGYLPDAAPKGACEREFAALRRCFLAASGLGRWRDEVGGGGSEAAEAEQLSGGRPSRRA